ncbi:MAG: hypothetical protein Q4F47_05430 [Bacteroidaceae bacterium]|nr:hypothetical protein [Bacteroidaceae bacterium]
MVRKLGTLFVLLLTAVVSFAQSVADSTLAILEDMAVPLVEKRHVANTDFKDNWYLGLYGGVVSNFGSDASHAGFFQVMGPAAALTFGKEITPVSGVRLQLNYTRNTGVTDNQFVGDFKDMIHDRFKWNSYALNIDYLLNFTNLICGFRENRKFHFQGIVGIGGSVSRNYTSGKYASAQGIDNGHGAQLSNQDKYQNRQHSLINIRAGVAGTFMVARNWNLHIEAVENFLDNSYDSNPTTKNTWDGHLDFVVGVSYRFNNKGGQAPGFYYPRHDMTVYKQKLAEIDDLRDKTKKRQQELEEQTDTIDVEAHVIYTLIAFDEGETTVDRLQQTNIYTTALAWSRAPQSLIYITNSSGVDDKLFQKRVKAIGDILLERYEIPSSRIRVCANESNIRPTGDYIVCIIND